MKKKWLVVTVQIPNDYVEALSNFLMEAGATGIHEVDDDPDTTRLTTYFLQPVDERKLLHGIRSFLKSVGAIYGRRSDFLIETGSLADQDWGENWKKFFKPLRVTERIIVKPPWIALSPKKGEIVIDIHPGMAFGTGTHSSTKLILRALEKNLKGKKPSVLDVGTGSGILSIAAARLGAREVWALDVDVVAVENARENLLQNSVSKTVTVMRGSVGSVRKRFDLLLANIDYKSLRRMRIALLRHLKTEGLLIVSGILERDAEAFRRFYLEAGLLQLIAMEQDLEWVCLTFKKKRQKKGPLRQ
jgi:ribosomal protein L11 methyltransferase